METTDVDIAEKQSNTATKPKKSKKAHKKLRNFIIVMLLVGALAGGALYGIHILRGPATGTVIQTSTPDIVKSPDGVITSDFLTAHYPGRYAPVQTQNQGASASLQAWTLYAHQVEGIGQSATIALVITNLPAGGVKSDSAYNLFSVRTDIYKLTTSTYKSEPVYIAKRHDPTYQYTVLWPHKKLLLTATLTAGGESDLVNNELNALLTSVEWAQ